MPLRRIALVAAASIVAGFAPLRAEPAGPAAPPEEKRRPHEEKGLPPRVSFRDAARTFVHDGGYLFSFPARTTKRGAWTTAAVAAGTILIMRHDADIRDHALEDDGPAARDIATKFEPLGRLQVQPAALGLAWMCGRLGGRPRLAEASARAFEAYLWSGITVSATKAAFGREAPGEGSEEGRFFAGGTAFPGGHAARSFAIAAVFADRYGKPGAWVAYPTAALVALATLEEDLHWASDLPAGAALGLAIGHGIAARHPAPGGADRSAARADRSAGKGVPASSGRVAWRIAPARGGATVTIAF